MSRSELAGLLAFGAEGMEGSARGIVLTSRSVPRRIWERRPVAVGGGEEVLWLRVEESHDVWTGDSEAGCDCGCGCVGTGGLCGLGVDLPEARA